MKPISRARRTLFALAAGATLLSALPVDAVHAATARWSGLGLTERWSDAFNWSPAATPADGDALLFGGLPPRATSVLDLSRSFASLSFMADAGNFFLHVSGEGSAELALVGVGLRNEATGTGPMRQTLFADAGGSGGTLRLGNNAGVNLGLGLSARPVDLIAIGAAVATQTGGHIVIHDQASVGTDTFDALRAQGGAVAGASGGEIILRDNALLSRLGGAVAGGGSSAGALGGRVTFQGQAQMAGGASVEAGQSGGWGGRLDFSGNAVALGTSSIYAEGGNSALLGAEGTVSFRGDARYAGSAYLGAGSVAGAQGGRIDFFERATHDTTGFPVGSGTLGIYNVGAVVSGAGGGALVFHDDSAVRGSHLLINNQTAEYIEPGAFAGSTSFLDRSRAGQVQIENAGAVGAGAAGGATYFRNQSNAESASIVMRGGVGAAAGGGSLMFGDDAGAGSAQVRNEGGSADAALGGSTRFTERASAQGATIVNASAIAGAGGGATTFTANSNAGNAYISNETALFGVGGRGTALFMDASSAQNATIDNQGGFALVNAFTTFSQSASAGSSRITNFGGRAAGAGGGLTQFLDTSSAGTAILVMAGGGVNGAAGGAVRFDGGASAAGATLDLRGASVVGAEGGTARFFQGTSAGIAIVTVQGAQVADIGGPEGATVGFHFDASAGSASFTLEGNRFASGAPGRVQFNDASNAANASFTTLAGLNSGGRLSFTGGGAGLASAGNARISNQARQTGALGTDDFGGATLFLARSTADRAVITNQSGLTAFGAQTVFRADSTAADATLVNAGGRIGDRGGYTFFSDTANAGRASITNQAGAGSGAFGLTQFGNTTSAAQATIAAAGASLLGGRGGRVHFTDQSTAGQATLIAEGGSHGGEGGRIEFLALSRGGTARVVLNAGSGGGSGGMLDISGVAVWLPLGSIEGGGQVELGARSLIIAGSGAVSTFSGVIRGDVPPVFPSLAVLGLGSSLTLSGANFYAGRTLVGDGVNANSGKLIATNTSGSATGSGEVQIERGGTLGGSGNIDGPVTLMDGGTVAPGDPVTLTLHNSLTWNGGGVIRLVLGADDAGSDHLVVQRLVKGSPGSFNFDFVDDGYMPGATYKLLSFDSIEGFTAGDFTFSGAVGSFSLADDTLGFTLAVPEPQTLGLWAAGLLMLGWRLRIRRA